MDAVFRALADPTRRSLLDELFSRDGQSLSALGRRLPMTRIGVACFPPGWKRPGTLLTLPDGSADARSSTSSTRSPSGSFTTDG